MFVMKNTFIYRNCDGVTAKQDWRTLLFFSLFVQTFNLSFCDRCNRIMNQPEKVHYFPDSFELTLCVDQEIKN